MDLLYFPITHCDFWVKTDSYRLLPHYFIDNGGFTISFLVALLVAVAGIILYYFWIGFRSDRLATVLVWLCTLLGVGVVTWCLTYWVVIGSNDAGTGLFGDITDYVAQLAPSHMDDTNFMVEINNFKQELAQACNPVTLWLKFWNSLISMLLYFILSLCVKRMTPFAKYVPF